MDETTAKTPSQHTQDLMLRCYNSMGHGQSEHERLKAAKSLYEWVTGSQPSKAG